MGNSSDGTPSQASYLLWWCQSISLGAVAPHRLCPLLYALPTCLPAACTEGSRGDGPLFS